MKKWMLAVGAGVVGVGLAIVVLPWSMGSINPVPPPPIVDDGPSASTPAQSMDQNAVANDRSIDRPIAEPLNDPSDGTATPAPDAASGGDGKDKAPAWVNPARKDRKDLLERPDIKMSRELEVQWQAMAFAISQMPHDPVADQTMQRVQQLERDLAIYRRDQSNDLDELMARQKHILGELKQSSYWGPELQQMESSVGRSWQEYELSR